MNRGFNVAITRSSAMVYVYIWRMIRIIAVNVGISAQSLLIRGLPNGDAERMHVLLRHARRITVACPAGTTGADCSSCKAGYTQCGMSGGYPLCLKISGVLPSALCQDYCNHAPGWGGHWTNGKGDYYVTRCSAGQTCYLASFAIGGYVQCY